LIVTSSTVFNFVENARSQSYFKASIVELIPTSIGRSCFSDAHFGIWPEHFMWTLNTDGRL